MYRNWLQCCIGCWYWFLLCYSGSVLLAQPTDKVDAFELGRMLFFDPVLSGNYKRSCASCHRPQKAFTDQRVTARSYDFSGNMTVNTPTLLGAARQRFFFHDGRAGSLSGAIQSVLTNPAELNNTYAEVVNRLVGSTTYRGLFWQVYGSEPSEQTINKALIAYLNRLSAVVEQTPEKRSVSIRSGLQVFVEAGCTGCHPAPDYRDGQRHEVAPGRWVRTPGLSNLMLTPPYLTDGSAPTLMAVLSSSFHSRQRSLSSTQRAQLIHFLTNIPADDATPSWDAPVGLPDIPNAPARRIGGSY